MPRFVRAFICLLLLLYLGPLTLLKAQSPVLSLTAETPTMQTGQEYVITIRVDGAPDLWLADCEISYDPTQVYILGTKAGSPVQNGALFEGAGSLTARNQVQGSRILFTVSKAGEVSPASGSGVIGTFRIYPLAPGKIQLQFARGTLRQLNAAKDGTDPVTFTPVLLELIINGDPVAPPNEATATPAPTDTPVVQSQVIPPTKAAEATLVNVTAQPVTPVVPEAAAGEAAPAYLMAAALIIMVIGALGTVIVLILWRRSRRQ